jgi:outer membrane murein-binding lipoprotein Lpp
MSRTITRRGLLTAGAATVGSTLLAGCDLLVGKAGDAAA